MSSIGASDHESKQAINQETYLKECDYCPKYHSNGNDLFWPKHITQILFKNV